MFVNQYTEVEKRNEGGIYREVIYGKERGCQVVPLAKTNNEGGHHRVIKEV